MIIKILSSIIKLLSLIPFTNYLFKIYYFQAIKKLKNKYKNKKHVADIILTSNFRSTDFIFGQSYLNFLIIVDNECHPKIILKGFRKYISESFLLTLTVNKVYIPILTNAELQTDTIKSFLIRKSYKDILKWRSIITSKDYIFHLRKQDHFAISHNSAQNLDFFLFQEKYKKENQTKIKNIYRSIQNLRKFNPQYLLPNKKWRMRSKFVQRFPLLSSFLFNYMKKESWSLLTNYEESYSTNNEYQETPINSKFIKYLNSLLCVEFINDFTLTPSIIQTNSSQVRGKLFIDIHVNKKITTRSYLQQVKNLKIGIKEFQEENLKFKIRLTTDFFYKLQNESAYYPFPLEALLRKKKTLSIAKKDYHFEIDHEQLICASIHFLTTQFMRFRSLEQKTNLIGSKFIKSFNLMYKYHLLFQFLKKDEFKLEFSENRIKEKLTPQLSDTPLDSIVTHEDWKIIKAQLLYLLKGIRDELLQYDRSLENLRF